MAVVAAVNKCIRLVSCLDGNETLIFAPSELYDPVNYAFWDALVGHLITIDGYAQFPGSYYVESICTGGVSGTCPECDPKNEEVQSFTDYGAITDLGVNTCDTCWLLRNCQKESDYIITPNDLSAYLGLIVKIEGSDKCYTVEAAGSCDVTDVTILEAFTTCEECLPEEVQKYERYTLKPVKKYYRITEDECTIDTNRKFANAYYKQFLGLNYGIENCCENINYNKLWIEKELADQAKLYDADLCTFPEEETPPEECPGTV